MFRKLDSNKKKMRESSSATFKASKTGLQTEMVVDDSPSLDAPSSLVAPVAQATVPPPRAAAPPPSSTGLPPLTLSRLSAFESLLPSAPRDPLAIATGLARQTLDFMSQHESVKGVPSEDLDASLRGAMLDVSWVSRHQPFFIYFA